MHVIRAQIPGRTMPQIRALLVAAMLLASATGGIGSACAHGNAGNSRLAASPRTGRGDRRMGFLRYVLIAAARLRSPLPHRQGLLDGSWPARSGRLGQRPHLLTVSEESERSCSGHEMHYDRAFISHRTPPWMIALQRYSADRSPTDSMRSGLCKTRPDQNATDFPTAALVV